MVVPRRRWRPALARVHRLLGLVMFLWLLLLGATGTLLAFKEEGLRLVQPGAAGPPLSREMLTPAGLAQRATAAEAAFGADRVRAVVLAGPSIALDQVYLRGHTGGGYLDPATGAVVARWAEGERLIDFLFDLHHTMLLGERGKTAVGVVGLLGAGLVLSGLILSWHMLSRLRGTVWPRTTTRSGLLVAHRELGLVAALPLLVLMLTGAAVVFPTAARALLGGLLAPAPPLPRALASSTGSDVVWERVFATALVRFPGASPRVVVWPQAPGAPLILRLQQSAEWHPNGRTAVKVSPAGGLVDAHDAVSAPLPDRLVYTAYPVHAGKVGGLSYKSLVALAGVALALLSAYGAIGCGQHLLGWRAAKARAQAEIQSAGERGAPISVPAGDQA